MQVVIGIDIGGTNFRIGAVDCNGNIYNFEKKSSGILCTGDCITALYDEITKYIKEYNYDDVKAITVGIPSIVSKDKKTVYSTPNLKGFDNINFVDPLSEKLNIPVILDRDVNFLLMNDIKNLNLDKSLLITGFYIGTGFGNAISINGGFLAGKNGVAGELGHIPLYGVDEQCTCGNHSCAETRCSGRRLQQLVKEHFSDVYIGDIFKVHATHPIIVDYVRSLAIPIATEINILDPDHVVIAGGVVIMEGFPKDVLEDAIRYYVRKPYPAKNLEILFTTHTQQSGVLGGARYAFENL